MSVLEFSALLFGTSLLAGFLGALTGLGGCRDCACSRPLLQGGHPVRHRRFAGVRDCNLVRAAVAYVREGLSNIRIGMSLEVATTIGACFGAYLAARVSNHWIAIVFGLVLLYSAIASFRQKSDAVPDAAKAPNALATRLQMNGVYPGPQGGEPYTAQRVPLGFGVMFGAGTLSGLLGIGSGAVKVLAMDQAMKLPFKVSTTTSNFMIGVTAAASAGIYLSRGYIDPQIAMPVMLGVLAGSLFGTRFLVKAKVTTLKGLFAVIILLLGCEMIFSGITGRI